MFKVKLLRQSSLTRLLFMLQFLGLMLFSPLSHASQVEEYQLVMEPEPKPWSLEIEHASYTQIFSIAVDSSNNVYVTYDRHGFEKFDENGKHRGLSGSGSYTAIAADSTGNVYVAENNRVHKLTDWSIFTEWASEGTGYGEFEGITDIAVSNDGHVYVLEGFSNRIQKFSTDGIFLASWGGEGRGDGQFFNPRSIAVDSSGNVYVVDGGGEDSRIQKFSADGTFLIKWDAGDGQSWYPVSIALDSSDNVYIAAHMGERFILKFSADGTFFTKWGLNSDTMFGPKDIAVDNNGNVYVLDDINRVQKYAPKTTNCANPATYDTATRIVSVPKIDVATLDVITGQPTDQIAVVSLQLQQQPGIDDFMIIDNSLQFLEFSTDYNPEHARYDYNTAQFWSGGKLSLCAQVPSVVVLPTGQMLAAPPKSYAVIMRQLAINPNVFHVETITPLP